MRGALKSRKLELEPENSRLDFCWDIVQLPEKA